MTRECCATMWDDVAGGCLVCGGPGRPALRSWEAGSGVVSTFHLEDVPVDAPLLLEELLP